MITRPIALAHLRTAQETAIYVTAHPAPAPLAQPMVFLRALAARAAWWSVALGPIEAEQKVRLHTRGD